MKTRKRLTMAENGEVGAWNVRGLRNKVAELQKELKYGQVDITVI
jgi:hypothetical protein